MLKRLLILLTALTLMMFCLSPALATSDAETAEPVDEDTLPLTDEPEAAPPPKSSSAITGIIAEGLNPPELTAEAAIVVELNSGLILYDKNAYEERPMASLTKVMTTLLALEHGDLDSEVTASASAVEGLDPDGSTAGIVTGETMMFRDLLYCVMVASANEACNVIAEEVAGSVDAFVDMMNERAKELGCKNTNFMNTHGLHDDQHYSSAYDMFLITKEAMKHPEFMELANTTSIGIPPTNMSKERSYFTTNHLISKRVLDGYQYHLARGVKTGHHSKAGYCLISSADSDGLNLITVVLGAQKVDSTYMSFIETKELMEWSFETYTFKRILNTQVDSMISVPVLMGEDRNSVNVRPSKTITALVPKVLDIESITQRAVIFDEGEIYAPISEAQQLGELTLSYRGYVFGTVPLIADFAIKRSETEYITDQVKTFLAEPWLINTAIGVVCFLVLYIIIVIIYNAHRRRNRARGNYRGNYRGRRRYK